MTLTELRTRRDNIEAEHAERKAELELWYANQTDALTAALWNLLDDAPVEAPVVVVVAPEAIPARRKRKGYEATLAAMGYTPEDIAGMSVDETNRRIDVGEHKAAPTTGPISALDLGWTAEQIESLRPGEADIIVRELHDAKEWRFAPNLTLVRVTG